MDWLKNTEGIQEIIKKYRYVLVVLLTGLFLLMLPKTREPETTSVAPVLQEETVTDLEAKLEKLLSHLEGAGKVKVLLTEAAGERRIFQTDESSDSGEYSTAIRRDTVVISDAGRNEDGLIQQRLPPVYLGAVVLCQGADHASVKLAIIEAVSSATGLATHHITVLKMK